MQYRFVLIVIISIESCAIYKFFSSSLCLFPFAHLILLRFFFFFGVSKFFLSGFRDDDHLILLIVLFVCLRVFYFVFFLRFICSLLECLLSHLQYQLSIYINKFKWFAMNFSLYLPLVSFLLQQIFMSDKWCDLSVSEWLVASIVFFQNAMFWIIIMVWPMRDQAQVNDFRLCSSKTKPSFSIFYLCSSVFCCVH